MDPALLSIFVLLQLVLSPLLYPFGYIIQGVVVLASGSMKYSFGEVEYSLLETLFLVWLICNMVMEEDINIAGYATRAGILLLRLCISPRLQQLGRQIVDPITSCFLFMQLIASPHLYPVGYLAQLGLILYLTLSGSLQVVTLWMLSSRKHFQKQFFAHGTSAFASSASLASSPEEENTLFASEDNMILRSSDEKSGSKSCKSNRFSPRKRSVSSSNSSNNGSCKSPSKRKKTSPNTDNKTPPTEAQLFFKGITWVSHQLYCLCIAPKSPPKHVKSINRDLDLASQGKEVLETNEEVQQQVSLDSEKEVEEEVEIDEEEEEEEEEEDPLLCKICFECPATTAFVACGHVCCRQCSDTLLNAARQQSVCPFCQCTVSQKIDLFFP